MCRNTSPYLRLQGYDSSSQPFKLREDKSYNFNMYVYLPATAQTVHKEGATIRLHIQLQVRLFFSLWYWIPGCHAVYEEIFPPVAC